ncbi:MAG: hypothetical protein ACTS8R_02940 [Arsenophonus sp. NC-QC1-MAG3]
MQKLIQFDSSFLLMWETQFPIQSMMMRSRIRRMLAVSSRFLFSFFIASEYVENFAKKVLKVLLAA